MTGRDGGDPLYTLQRLEWQRNVPIFRETTGSERSSERFRTQFETFPVADPQPRALTLLDALSISPRSAGRVPA